MTAENSTSIVRGFPRRTILKTAAWSVPVVAAAVATPFAAASDGNDVSIYQSTTDLTWAHSSDNLRWLETGAYTDFILRATGPAPTPVGTLITVAYDNRYLDGPVLTTGGTSLSAAAPAVNGSRTSVTFTLPVEIPVDGTNVVVDVTWARRDVVYVEDPENLTLTIVPAAVDPDLSNNTSVYTPRFITTYDASVTGTFTAHPYGDPSWNTSWHMIDTVSIEALTPGDIATGGSLMVVVPVAAVSNITIGTVTIDGTPASSAVTLQSQNDSALYFAVNAGIPAGSTMVITFAYDVTPDPVTEYPGACYASFTGNWTGDRDASNDQAYSD
jgi:hypothetical protein